MNRFFNMDSPLFVALGRLADFMILNIIFIITCIPIVTIGASCTAMSYMTLKMVRNEETYIVKGYFKSFKENFRQSTVIWLICLVLGIVFYMDFKIVQQLQGTTQKVMSISLGAVSLFLIMGYIYVFPVLSKFYNSIRNTIKNALIMAILNFPITVILLVIDVIAIVITCINGTIFTWALLIWIMFGFSVISYLNSFFLVKVFDKYIPEEDKEKPSDGFTVNDDAEYEMSAFKNLHPQDKEEE